MLNPETSREVSMSATVMVVVQGYERHENGELYALVPMPVRDAAHGMQVARTLNCAGAVVFSRAGDPDLGDWEDATILLAVGQVPNFQDEAA
jgi:hypothetical protein